MDTIRLGRTGLVVSKNGFGALPVQRVTKEDAVHLLRRAYEGGINYFDTARVYSDSEEKLGLALSDVRENIVISTKTASTTAEGFWADLNESLRLLKTDYIDIYQFHNPAFCPRPGDASGLYDAALEAKAKGLIRHIGITNHRLAVAEEAVRSGLYETLQFPFSYLASEKEIALVRLCEEQDMGFICMKALAGGLITRSDVAYAFLLPWLPIIGGETLDDGGATHAALLHEGKELHAESVVSLLQAGVEYTRLITLGKFCQIAFLTYLVTQRIGFYVLG